MSAAVYRSGTPSLAVPQTQNTAPVLEFNCMYTHDIRRKQKRWQDGFLRFHTFNNRIMVYDVPRNFIGDTHWKAGSDLQDGDEVQLEGSCVMVQVAEQVGRTETDLTELRRSRKKGSSEASLSSPVRGAQPSVSFVSDGNAPRAMTQLKHRSLNALLGTPKGPIGKAALPTKSPFEERYHGTENSVFEGGRPTKRMRIESPPSWNITRTTTTAKPVQRKEPPQQPRNVDSAKQKKIAPLETGQRKLGTTEIIDLSIESDEPEQFLAGLSSDALLPASSPHKERTPVMKVRPIRSSSPAFQRQRTPELGPRRISPDSTAMPDAINIREVPVKVKASALEVQVDDRAEQLQGRVKQQQSLSGKSHFQRGGTGTVELPQTSDSIRPPDSGPSKTLRMTATAPKKKTLLCQDQVSKKPSRVHSANTENAIDALLDATSQDVAQPKQKAKSQRQQLEERLAKIGRKGGVTRHETLDRAANDANQPFLTNNKSISGVRPQTPLSNTALEPAQPDQTIMPPALAQSPQAPIAPITAERQLRRVVSESQKVPTNRPKRTPGAPVRFTPSPAKKASDSVPQNQADQAVPPKQIPIVAPRLRAKTAMQRSLSLNTTSNGTSTVLLSRPFRAPTSPLQKVVVPEKPADPWSREAFDLFTWRPPGWDEEKWCLKATVGAVDLAG